MRGVFSRRIHASDNNTLSKWGVNVKHYFLRNGLLTCQGEASLKDRFGLALSHIVPMFLRESQAFSQTLNLGDDICAAQPYGG
jgi:hypothetical protein